MLKTGKLLLRAFLIAVLIVTAASYVMLSPLVAGMTYSHILFFPQPPNELYKLQELDGVPKRDIYVRALDGKVLHGWLFEKSKAPHIVLISHGNAGNLSHRLPLIQSILKAGQSVFIYDYEGFGRSSGSPTLGRACEDGMAAYQYLTGPAHYPSKKIILWGESIGGGITCYIAERTQFAAIVLQSTFTSLLRIARQKVSYCRLYPDWLCTNPSLDNISFLKQRTQPLLIIHGMKDTTIPFDEARANFFSARQPKQLIALEHAGHNDVGISDHQQFQEELTRFFGTVP